MPRQVTLHQLNDLSHKESPNEILLDTQIKTELHIISKPSGETIIKLPFGNKFDIVDGQIIIHEK